MARKSNFILLTSLSIMSNLSRSLGSDSRRCGSREVDAEGSESRIKLHNCLYKTNQSEGKFSRYESIPAFMEIDKAAPFRRRREHIREAEYLEDALQCPSDIRDEVR